MACKNLHMNHIGTLKLLVRILTTYLILVMVIPALHAILPFKPTLSKRQSVTEASTLLLDSKMVDSARHCSQRCSQRVNCKAFNAIRVQQEAPGLQCEMFRQSDPDMQVDDEGAVFWELNYCHGHVCKNGGGCRIENEAYICVCDEGYTGQYCETDIDECASNPCDNAGVCTDVVAGFTCACAAGWEGTTCQTNINECASNPCMNGGTCNDSTNRYVCSCRTGYRDAHCQTECKYTAQGKEYTGTMAVTSYGRTCQRWDTQNPHSHGHSYLPGNYCRNPDDHVNLWCYTTDPNVRWEECSVPYC